MEPARLSATDLACRRGERLLFRGLSFALDPGQALQLAGPNGVGKSSLIRILAGLLRPFAGTLDRAGATGLIDERPALDGDKPLGEALAFWAALDAPAAAAPNLGVDALLDIPVRYLSTGQRKRAALVRLARQGAPIWLLDEPLNGLDVDAARACETLVADHCARGGLAVVASHQPFALPGLRQLALADFAP
ncbi:MAG: heme ABC exporter ATP-binding protein CcmA [Sphingomonadales bacterium 32-68-7]|nr:MAG: heme ABC exporter ATP-binding protein CcmA [Sphingomonadales bacterium 12-68-11]OYX08425.1 MAG: heme ABC exporter ATP-binding protein CcmA [Sphingomonadales bacterium 32-68-7]